MKLSVFLFLFGIISVQASEIFSQTSLSIQMNDASVEDVLEEIQSQCNYDFIYDYEYVKELGSVDVDFNAATLDVVLYDILKNSNLDYRLEDEVIILFPRELTKPVSSELNKGEVQQENKIIKGVVTDENGVQLPGVSVVGKGTSIGTATGIDGDFTLSVPSELTTIVVSFIGMLTQEIELNGQVNYAIVLKSDAENLDEIVVVGYGTQKKINLTGAVSAVNMDKISESRPVTNIASALSGVAPGLFVTSSNNRPDNNGNSSILIRGQGTLNNSAPLVIVDGVEGSLNSVNPQDVESVSVLKDAASAAIYGSRAANGVILVTTKKGKEGKVVFDYSGQLSMQSVENKLDLVTDYATYMELLNEGKRNSGQGEQFSQEKIDEWRADGGKNPLKYPNNDWQDDVFDTGLMMQHNFSASGGSDKIHFYMSYNYLDNPGVIDNSGYEKHSMRANLESEVNDWFKFGVQLSGYTSDTEMGANNLQTVFDHAQASTPGMVFISPDGRYGTVNNSEDDPQANNMLRLLHSTVGEDKANSIKSRFYAQLSPLKGLTLNASYVYDFYDRKKRTQPKFIPTWDFYTNTMVSDGVSRTSIKNENWNTYRHFMDIYARYETSFADDKLDFSIFGGGSQEQFRRDNFYANRLDLIDPTLGVINGAVGESSTYGRQVEWAMHSFFGRLNLGWDDKYLLEVNVRGDASSRFLSDKRWGYFPSFSMGWRMIEEDFLQNIDWLSNLKLRGSYGALGNNSLSDDEWAGNYDAIPVYSTRNYVLNNAIQTGLVQASIANAKLSWESTYITDIGLDFGLFKNRLTGTFDYFNKVTKDILINLPAPDVHGTASIPKQNAAQVSNEGFELMLSYKGNIGSDFSYGIAGNVTYIKNKVDKFKGDVASYSGDNQILEGRPVNEKYVLQFDRIIQTDADVAMVDQMIADAPFGDNGSKLNPFAAFGRPEKGDILYSDMNNDGLINNDDRFMTGYNSLPDWTFGLNLTTSYKGFDFGMLVQGTFGARENFVNFNYSSSVRYGYQINSEVADGRYYEGRDVLTDPASFPRLLEFSKSAQNNQRNSTFWMANKSYIRIKNIQLGYTVPTDLLQRAQLGSLQKVRMYTSLENFFTFTDWPGLDPEVNGVNYPVIKQFVIGLNVSF